MTDCITKAISAAKQQTSTEVKVMVLRYCWPNLRDKAKSLFSKHEFHKTKGRNAVMILLVLINREFLVYGDKGIHEVKENFWLNVCNAMAEKFQIGDLIEGLCTGVVRVGIQLATYFPRANDDAIEISENVDMKTDVM